MKKLYRLYETHTVGTRAEADCAPVRCTQIFTYGEVDTSMQVAAARQFGITVRWGEQYHPAEIEEYRLALREGAEFARRA